MVTTQEICVPVGEDLDGAVVYYILNPETRSLDCVINGQKVGFQGFTSKQYDIKKSIDNRLQKLIWHIEDVEDWSDMFYKRRMDIKPELMAGASTVLVSDVIKQAKEKTDNLDAGDMSRRKARKTGATKKPDSVGTFKL
jgi:hypothetical protein